MPQWNRDRSAGSFPDERWQATCPADVVPLLLRYDHHTVWLEGRPALLLTYTWATAEVTERADAQRLDVSFTYADGHPTAPPSVQAVVDKLTFTPVLRP